MMFAIFAILTIAFLLDFLGWRWPRRRLPCGLAGLTVYLFAWEIYSPDYGFRMPWLEL